MVKRHEQSPRPNAQQNKVVKRPNSLKYKDLVSKTTVDFLHKMQYNDVFINEWQKKRMIRLAMFLIIAIVLQLLLKNTPITGATLALGIVDYIFADKRVANVYLTYRFERNLAFAKFTRLVVPYLRADGNGTESKLYKTLGAVVKRLDKPEDKQLLSQLLAEIVQDPEDKEPYRRYAMKMGGDDFALTFMETLFDIRQGATSLDVIQNLAKDSSKRIQKLTGDIIRVKEKKLYNFLTAVVLLLILPILGIVASILLDGLSSFWQGGGLTF